ncbi:isochorismatase family cysteine hydrolase [Solidesulfovibrio sp.]|uniref:cysteine hydrolase family protein n=1 Tax=Solidesulfovibrio sp. TaxID=2910990 RepID=UPI002B1EB560|nr:isochorismatase family cysteine hydrolase [Solidesulfovibrio sp.]MEA4855552.1 isochorismatase family cysteine hydrolase [Solidesulfovibrio sp.]
MDKAFVIVDMLNDFITPGGNLFFPKGQGAVAPIVRLRQAFRAVGAPVIYDNDAHPEDSEEFAHWPVHCVMGTHGARIVDALAAGPGDIVIHKDALSLFADGRAARVLRGLGVKRLYVAGVATEYCVKEAVLHALEAGFAATVVRDAIAAVDLDPEDGARAVAALAAAGADFATTEELLAELSG